MWNEGVNYAFCLNWFSKFFLYALVQLVRCSCYGFIIKNYTHTLTSEHDIKISTLIKDK